MVRETAVVISASMVVEHMTFDVIGHELRHLSSARELSAI